MFRWLRMIIRRPTRAEFVARRPYSCGGCDREINRHQKARRCDCTTAWMRHESCMTGPVKSCPICLSRGVPVVWK
jgi:hypothetical protein